MPTDPTPIADGAAEMNVIPEMTDPLGRCWRAPNRDAILVDATHAVMSAQDERLLHWYDGSTPSGTYQGKMWGRRYKGKKLLVWFGPHPEPNTLSINYRELLIVGESTVRTDG